MQSRRACVREGVRGGFQEPFTGRETEEIHSQMRILLVEDDLKVGGFLEVGLRSIGLTTARLPSRWPPQEPTT
jgi:hypothetical protein